MNARDESKQLLVSLDETRGFSSHSVKRFGDSCVIRVICYTVPV